MRILAIETSGRAGSLALLQAETDSAEVLETAHLETGQRTAQALSPAMRDLLRLAGLAPSDIGLVAVAVGPGSFTGLRLGVTTAKIWAFAVGAELVGVDTLDVLAAQISPGAKRNWTVLDAQRNELFVGQYTGPVGMPPKRCEPTCVLATDDLLAQLAKGDLVTGPFLEHPVLKHVAEQLPAGVALAERTLWFPQAATVGKVAWHHYVAGRRDDPWQMVPVYGRPSAAEEKWRRKEEERGSAGAL